MTYETIADIYSANQKIREGFTQLLNSISPDEAAAMPVGEKWPIQHLAEHVAIVSNGISRICGKLVEAAKQDNRPSDGSFTLPASFGERAAGIAGIKVEAPERVHPTGNVTIAQALDGLATATAAYDSLRTDMASYDLSGHTFPHPFFGDLTAGEWLVMAGLHERRHGEQITALLAKVRK